MLLTLFLTASLAPVAILLIYIYAKDQYKKEPFGTLMKAFLGGIGAALLVLLLAYPLKAIDTQQFSSPLNAAFYKAFGSAAIPEELCKFFFLYILIWKNPNFDEYYDGIEYAVFVGLGFAALENILYVFQGGLQIAISRALFAVPAHFFFGVIMGFFFAFAKFRPQHKKIFLLLSICSAILAHGTYDFILMYGDFLKNTSPQETTWLMIAFYAFVILLWKIGNRLITKLSGE